MSRFLGLSMRHILTIFLSGIKKASDLISCGNRWLLGVLQWKSIQHVGSAYKIICSLSVKMLRALHNAGRSLGEVLLKSSPHLRVYECGVISDAALRTILTSSHLLTQDPLQNQDPKVKNISEECSRISKGIDPTLENSQRFGSWSFKSAGPFTITSSQHNITTKTGCPRNGMT